jgi:hypothetical protein
MNAMPAVAASLGRQDGGGHGAQVARHGRHDVRRGGDRRVRVVPGGDGGRHHPYGLRPELRRRQGRVQAPDAAHGIRLRGVSQGLHSWIQVIIVVKHEN